MERPIVKSLYKTEALYDISKDLGQVFFASAFLGPLLSSEEGGLTAIMGLVFAILSWICAVVLAKN
jgi:hypothetical protein